MTNIQECVRRLAWAAAIGGVLVAGAAAAQGARTVPFPRLNIERFELNPSGQGSLVVDQGELLDEGGFRLGIAAHYVDGPAVTRLGGDNASLRLDSRLLGNLTGAYAPNKWVQLELQVPVIFHQTESDALADRGFAPVASSGYAAPLVGLRVGVLRQKEDFPVDLALSATVGLPVGHGGALGRDDQVPFRPALSVGRDFGRVKVGGSLYGQLRSQENFAFRGVSGSEQDTVTHELGFGVAVGGEVVDRVRAELGLTTDFALRDGGYRTQAWVGGRYELAPKMELFAVAGPGFGDLVGTPRYRALLGLAFGMGEPTPAPKEEPELATIEPIPEEPVKVEPPVDADTDGDGVPDSKDACPNEVGPAHRAGCPVPDADGDGIPDDIDRCPNEKGEPDEGGCPAKDGDKDGVPDKVDRCPTKPGPGTEHGCPDTDGDGVADHMDNCVLEKGPSDNQGCPPKQKQLVVITKEKLQILDKVYFTPGKATIMPKSRPLLNQIAKVLKEHPEIQQIVIEGHTDSTGNAEKNKKLSQDRAESVKKYLVRAGVADGRMVAKGFGPEVPVDTNDTAEGREVNRRVEFVIVDPTKGQSGDGTLIEPLIRDE